MNYKKINIYISIFSLFLIIITSCGQPTEGLTNTESDIIMSQNGWIYNLEVYDKDIHYKVFYTGHGLFVVNVTKDSLEVINLKNQLKK